jgi:hypothetical protein
VKPLDRAAVSEMIFNALRATWQAQDDHGCVRDAAHLQGILRGGCAAFLTGDFDASTDGVSLGLAFLSLARDALLGGDFAAIINGTAQGEA